MLSLSILAMVLVTNVPPQAGKLVLGMTTLTTYYIFGGYMNPCSRFIRRRDLGRANDKASRVQDVRLAWPNNRRGNAIDDYGRAFNSCSPVPSSQEL